MFCLVVMMTLQESIDGKVKNCLRVALTELSRPAELAALRGGTLHVPSVFLKALLKAPQPQLRIQVPMVCIPHDRPTITKKGEGHT